MLIKVSGCWNHTTQGIKVEMGLRLRNAAKHAECARGESACRRDLHWPMRRRIWEDHRKILAASSGKHRHSDRPCKEHAWHCLAYVMACDFQLAGLDLSGFTRVLHLPGHPSKLAPGYRSWISGDELLRLRWPSDLSPSLRPSQDLFEPPPRPRGFRCPL